MKLLDTFLSLYEDDREDIERYLTDVFGLLHEDAANRGIEFDGYFNTKWSQSADTIVNFDEEYFADLDRRNLYVYKAAETDPEILLLLQEAYRLATLKVPAINDIHREIFELEEKGVSF